MTAQEVFDLAMGHIAEVLDNGTVDANSTKEHKARAPMIMTTAQYEIISVLNDTKAQSFIAYPSPITSLTDEIALDEYIGSTSLVYLFIGRLLATEEPTISNLYMQLYNETRSALLKRTPSTPIKRSNVYQGGEVLNG